jgi:hypothetical protein
VAQHSWACSTWRTAAHSSSRWSVAGCRRHTGYLGAFPGGTISSDVRGFPRNNSVFHENGFQFFAHFDGNNGLERQKAAKSTWKETGKMSEKKTLSELELSRNVGNLNRAKKRELPPAPLGEGQKSELARLDELIDKTMKACHYGQTIGGKRNPAFGHLAILMKLRKLVANTKMPKKSAEELLKEAEELFKVN